MSIKSMGLPRRPDSLINKEDFETQYHHDQSYIEGRKRAFASREDRIGELFTFLRRPQDNHFQRREKVEIRSKALAYGTDSKILAKEIYEVLILLRYNYLKQIGKQTLNLLIMDNLATLIATTGPYEELHTDSDFTNDLRQIMLLTTPSDENEKGEKDITFLRSEEQAMSYFTNWIDVYHGKDSPAEKLFKSL